VFLSFADYSEEEFSKNAASKGVYAVLPQSRPLVKLFEAEKYRRVKELLRMSPVSGIRPPGADVDWQPSPADLAGNVPVLLLSQSVRNDVTGALVRSNVLAAGSVLAINESLLGSPNIANSEYFLDTLGSLSNRERTVRIEDKTIGFGQLSINFAQVIVIAAAFMVLLPLVILVIGIVVWLRRRHR
jgi:hypothetical protein